MRHLRFQLKHISSTIAASSSSVGSLGNGIKIKAPGQGKGDRA